MLKEQETDYWFQIWLRLSRNEISDEELHQINTSNIYNNLNRASDSQNPIETPIKLTARID